MIDRVDIMVRGGDGGAGSVHFRREKYVPRGGPDGGDGGAGGNVVVIASGSVRTLTEIGRRRSWVAEHGQKGIGAKRHGRRGRDRRIEVPVGTEIWLEQEGGSWNKAADLVAASESFVVARGGLGGWGNTRFATPTHRTPRIAQRGQPGEPARVRLELKLLADAGIVGLPNAGKSTLLRAISAARPRVGPYPFTTLEPALGVVEVGWERFVVADIPGLIEGAHQGAGLGLDFLRHVERTRVLVHLIDGSSAQPLGDIDCVNNELGRYGRMLEDRPQIVVVNKIDIPEVHKRQAALADMFRTRDVQPLFISAAAGTGVSELTAAIAAAIQAQSDQPAQRTATERVQRPALINGALHVAPEGAAYRVYGSRAVTFAEMMPLESEEGRAELWRRLGRWGVVRSLRRAGAKQGDIVRLGSVELELEA